VQSHAGDEGARRETEHPCASQAAYAREGLLHGTGAKRDAEDFAATVEVRKLEGTYIAPSLGRITVAELAPPHRTRKLPLAARTGGGIGGGGGI
jgi:hypothetical protein